MAYPYPMMNAAGVRRKLRDLVSPAAQTPLLPLDLVETAQTVDPD